jgi:DNA-binding LacI/PurR family transcriptional regulator
MLKKTTIVDIAKAAGVSVSTVSRILNNKPDVAEETRQRVLQVIEEQRFAPQITWQQLRSGKSRFIALHFPQDFNPPSHAIITSAALQCEQAGFSLNLIVGPLNENDLLAIFRSGQADGMILMEMLTHDWRVELLRQHNIPFVMIGRCIDNTGLSYVDCDIEAGIVEAASHLAGLGHRHIGFVAVAPTLNGKEYGYTSWARKGFETACAQYGLQGLARAADLSTNAVAHGVTQLLQDYPEITAIITPQNTGVAGILKAITACGLRIPDDISIVGLLEPSFAEVITPPLTALQFPAQQMGCAAVDILLDRLNNAAAEPQQSLIRPELCVRGSTGPNRDQ